MKSTNAYAAKRALIDRLATLAGTGQPLDGWQVAYRYPAMPDWKCVYGGGVTFQQTEGAAERGVLRYEVATVGIYFRLVDPDDDARTSDTIVEDAADAFAADLAANPSLGLKLMFLSIERGMGDYFPSDRETTTPLGLQIQVESYL
ncbi:MAG TPA: hypothetical protein VF054_06655 [Micromonosporaceae bacterium]